MPRPAPGSPGYALTQALASFSPALPLAVAYSGGADSTALLHGCAQRWPGQVAAIHVHHGLQAAADDFVRHCEATCAALQLPLAVVRVDARKRAGQSPEDAARHARYAALASALAQPVGGLACRSVALAQHADDQVETILLALSRGAGLAGLAAMPAQWERNGVTFHRPLLGVPAATVRAWVKAQGLPFVEDPSNADQGLTRNRIRARLLPALNDTFGAFRETFARSAAHAAQAQRLLDQVAAQDLVLASKPGDGQPVITALQKLSRERQANLLRHWLKTRHQAIPSAAQLDELLDQVQACTTRGHHIDIRVAAGFVQRHGDALAWYNGSADSAARA